MVDDSDGDCFGSVRITFGIRTGIRIGTFYLHLILRKILPDTTDIKGYFNTLASDWNNNYRRSILFSERLDKIKELTSDITLKDKIVLDIGCGSGMISSYFCEQGSAVYGIDISEKMIQQANTFIRSHNLHATLSVGDASALQFPDNYFDLITCISVIEWLDKDKEAIGEIQRVLKKDGMAIISVPNQKSLLRKIEKVFFKLKKAISPLLKLEAGYLTFQKHQYSPDKFDEFCNTNKLRKTDSLFYVAPFSKFTFIRKLSRYRLFGMIYFVKLQKYGD